MTGRAPLAPPPRPVGPNRRPSLAWRIRRWLRLKCCGDARRNRPYEPATEWGKVRAEDRERRKALERRAAVDRLQKLVTLVDPEAPAKTLRFRRDEELDAIVLEEPDPGRTGHWLAVDTYRDLDAARATVEEWEARARGKRRAFEAFLEEQPGGAP